MATFAGSGIAANKVLVDPAGLTNVTATDAQGAIAELDAAVGGGGGGGDLAATLVLGNVTGGTDIVISSGDIIQSAGGNARGTNAIDLQLSRTLTTQVAATPTSALLGGTDNTLSPATIPADNRSVAIIGGSGNTIGGESSYNSVILGGTGNTIGVGGTYHKTHGSVILGGGGNTIQDYAYYTAIIGQNNRVGGGAFPYYFHPSSLVVGAGNVVEGGPPWGGSYYSLTVGRNNVMAGGQNSGIIGRFCAVYNQNSFSGGNSVVNHGYGTFMWGQNHDSSSAAQYVYWGMAFGSKAYLYCQGQASWGSTNIAAISRGGAQRSTYSLVIRTTTAAATVLSVNGATANAQRNRLRIRPGRVYGFRITLAAYQYGGVAGSVADSATWEITGAIKRTLGSTTTLLGVAGTGTPLYSDAGAATWSVAVTADNTNNALQVTVTGELDKSVIWHGSVYVSEAGADA